MTYQFWSRAQETGKSISKFPTEVWKSSQRKTQYSFAEMNFASLGQTG